MKHIILVPPNKKAHNVVQDFLYGCWCRGRRIGGMQMPPLNHLYVATTLKQHGFDAKFIDANLDPSSYQHALGDAARIQTLIILSSTNSFKNDVDTIEVFKNKNPNIKSILFGSHPTIMPKHCLQEPAVDFCVIKEPEFIILNLIQCIDNHADWHHIHGLSFRQGDRTTCNPPHPFVEMDTLPIPDRSLLPAGVDYFNPVVKRVPYTTMQTSRGCFAKCNFCTVPGFYGNKIRYRSAENVLQEIHTLISQGYKEIFFRDETFTAFRQRNIKIIKTIIQEQLDITWIANGRVDMVDKEQLSLMKQAGCHLLKFGVESGNQKILDNLNKGITLEQTQEAFALCHEIGIKTHAHVMLGCPGETTETIRDTIRFVKALRPKTASFGLLMPFPGTPIFEQVKAKRPEIADGSDITLDHLHVSGFYNEIFTKLTNKELKRALISAYRLFYLRPGYLFHQLMHIDSFDELMRLLIAGSHIFNFSIKGNN